MAVQSTSFFQNLLYHSLKLDSSSSKRACCVLLQRSRDIKWEKADTNMWHKKLGGYSSRSSFIISSSFNDNTVQPLPAFKFQTVSPYAIYSFMRPYAALGTVLAVISSSLMAVETLNDISLPFFIGIMQSLAVLICIHGFGCGINQIFDLKIDKVNKPDLPLPSGEINYAMGIAITSAYYLMAFGASYFIGSKPLLTATFIASTISFIYSVNIPFLRWKRFAVTAAMLILVSRALVIPSTIYLHMQTFIFKRSTNYPRSLIYGSLVLSFFLVAMALFKDIPDIKGDIKYDINSLVSRLGKKKVFWICVYLLQMGYAVAVVLGATAGPLWCKIITVLSHTVLASIVWRRANSIDFTSEDAIKSFYMFIWKLIYIEYLLIPMLR